MFTMLAIAACLRSRARLQVLAVIGSAVWPVWLAVEQRDQHCDGCWLKHR
jgi:hypothetical protein